MDISRRSDRPNSPKHRGLGPIDPTAGRCSLCMTSLETRNAQVRVMRVSIFTRSKTNPACDSGRQCFYIPSFVTLKSHFGGTHSHFLRNRRIYHYTWTRRVWQSKVRRFWGYWNSPRHKRVYLPESPWTRLGTYIRSMTRLNSARLDLWTRRVDSPRAHLCNSVLDRF
jgi:hypothetical protein